MKRTVQINLLILLLFSSSCVRQYSGYSPQEKQRIETRLGLRLASHDNVHLYRESSLWIGTPHRYGGCSTRGIDCSCFVSQLYKSVYRKELQRNSQQMYNKDCRRISTHALREGDLVFFGNNRKVDHVGVYLKHGHFVHSSTSKGVIVSKLNEPYYKKRFISGGRVR